MRSVRPVYRAISLRWDDSQSVFIRRNIFPASFSIQRSTTCGYTITKILKLLGHSCWADPDEFNSYRNVQLTSAGPHQTTGAVCANRVANFSYAHSLLISTSVLIMVGSKKMGHPCLPGWSIIIIIFIIIKLYLQLVNW